MPVVWNGAGAHYELNQSSQHISECFCGWKQLNNVIQFPFQRAILDGNEVEMGGGMISFYLFDVNRFWK